MKKPEIDVKPLPERIYRLRLLEGITILTRDEAGKDGGYDAEERQWMVEDLIRLSRELPYPADASEIDALIEKCRSRWARTVDRDLVGLVVGVAYGASVGGEGGTALRLCGGREV